MPSLIDLPSELLYQIIDFVACSPYKSLTEGSRHRPEHLRNRSVVCYPETEILWSSGSSLLLVCRRLHAETSAYLSKRQQSFQLDLAIIDDNWIWPTWKSLPFESEGLVQERLDVNIILCCTENERETLHLDILRSEETRIEVSKIVSRLLLQGPQEMASDQPLHGHRGKQHKGAADLRFRLLTFNIDTVRHQNGKGAFSKEEIPFRFVTGLAHLDFDPLYPLDAPFMKGFARVTKQALSRLTHGLVIKERVDEIVFKVDQETIEKISISGDARSKRERELAEYKARLAQS